MSDVATYWWDTMGEWVEPPNVRRGGESGVQYVHGIDGAGYYVKRQTRHLFRSLRYPTGRPTLLREWRNLAWCARHGVPTPSPVFFDLRASNDGWQALLVTRALSGYVSLEAGLSQQHWSRREREAVYAALAIALGRLHRSRRKHGHLYPKEVFARVGQQVSVALVDWEVSRFCPLPRQAAQSDLGRLWRGLTELGVSDEERARFFQHYADCTGLRDLRLRGLPAKL